jgi:hypothetical protein
VRAAILQVLALFLSAVFLVSVGSFQNGTVGWALRLSAFAMLGAAMGGMTALAR